MCFCSVHNELMSSIRWHVFVPLRLLSRVGYGFCSYCCCCCCSCVCVREQVHTHTHTHARARAHTHTHSQSERASKRERERESLHNGSESLARNMKTVPYVPVCQFCRSWRVLTVWLRKKHTIQRMFRVSWYPTKKTDYVTYILIERIVLVWISLWAWKDFLLTQTNKRQGTHFANSV